MDRYLSAEQVAEIFQDRINEMQKKGFKNKLSQKQMQNLYDKIRKIPINKLATIGWTALIDETCNYKRKNKLKEADNGKKRSNIK